MAPDKPRFRRDLLAVPVEAGGQSYIEVRDPRTRRRYCFYDFEYRVALAFDGLPLEKVIPWVRLSTGLAFRVDQLEEFAGRLHDLGLLEAEAAPAVAEAVPDPPGKGFDALEPPPNPDDVVLENVATPEAVVEPQAQILEFAQPLAPEPEAQDKTPLPEVASAVPASDNQSEALGIQPPRPAQRGEGWGEGASEAGPLIPTFSPADRGEGAPEFPVQPGAMPTSQPSEEPPPAAAEATHASDIGEDERPDFSAAPKSSADFTAFPVLPAPRGPAAEPVPPVAPPPRVTPRPLTAGTAPRAARIVETPSARQRIRRSFTVFAALGVLAAAAVLALVLSFMPSWRESPLADVRTVVVAPGSILRYFDGAGIVRIIPPVTLEFPAAGKVTRMANPGAKVVPGDVVAAVEIAQRLQTQLNRQRERLAFYQQMADAMHEIGNATEEERQVAKVQVRNAVIAKTLRALADVAVIANHTGQVEEVFAHEGDSVAAGSPALRLRPTGVHVEFEFSREQAAKAQRLAFCRVEVDGYVLECTQAEGESPRFRIALSSVPLSLMGKTARLARARFDGATVVPSSAIVRTSNRNEVLVVSPQARVELRPVTLADEVGGEAVVVQGLDVGDRVIVDPASNLRAGVVVGLAP